MKIYAIGDLHLSFGEESNKPMDIFGKEWENHGERLKEYWNDTVKSEDIVIICGDVSWALRPEEADTDLKWIDALKGRKVIFKGNHDLWWQSTLKLNRKYEGSSLTFVQNNAYMISNSEIDTGIAVCGSRGWICPGTDGFTGHDRKIYEREALRLKMSLDDGVRQGAEKIIGVLHFPPTNDKQQGSLFTETMEKYNVKTCIYGHLHGKDVFKNGLKGLYNSVKYQLVSYDYLEGKLKEIEL